MPINAWKNSVSKSVSLKDIEPAVNLKSATLHSLNKATRTVLEV